METAAVIPCDNIRPRDVLLVLHLETALNVELIKREGGGEKRELEVSRQGVYTDHGNVAARHKRDVPVQVRYAEICQQCSVLLHEHRHRGILPQLLLKKLQLSREEQPLVKSIVEIIKIAVEDLLE